MPRIAALLTMDFRASSFVVIRDAGDHFSPGPISLLRMDAAVIVNIGLLLVADFAGMLLGEGLPTMLLIGTVVSKVGIGVIRVASFNGEFTVGGVLLSLIAAIFYAACVVLQKHFPSHADSVTVTVTVTVTWGDILAGTLAGLIFTPGLIAEVVQAPVGITVPVICLSEVLPPLAALGGAFCHLDAAFTIGPQMLRSLRRQRTGVC